MKYVFYSKNPGFRFHADGRITDEAEPIFVKSFDNQADADSHGRFGLGNNFKIAIPLTDEMMKNRHIKHASDIFDAYERL